MLLKRAFPARSFPPDEFLPIIASDMIINPNALLYGDNLDIMPQMKQHSVDLIYLDPPFNSQQSYNMVYSTLTGRPVAEQKVAFADTWSMTDDQVQMLDEMPTLVHRFGIDPIYSELWRTWLMALKDTNPRLLSYLIYMLRRLMEMSVLLKDTGSIYVHCDPTASHYLKVLMDGLFKHSNFRSEIIWKRTTAHSASRRWNDVHDTILFYSKTDKYRWNRVVTPHSAEYLARFKRSDPDGSKWTDDNLTGPGVRNGESGQPWRGFDPTAKGSHWKVSNKAVEGIVGEQVAKTMGTIEKLEVLDGAGLIYWPQKAGANSFPRFKRKVGDGTPIQDVVTDIAALNSQAEERLGYATQKPIALLKRIIEASTNEGETVFDPFCGCGTSVYAAHETGRKWLGCDIAVLAVDIVAKTLYSRYGLQTGEHFEIQGIPLSREGADRLFEHNKGEFQDWAVQLAGGHPLTRKSGDRGIDGILLYKTEEGDRTMVLQVKGGQSITTRDIRDLRGVLERERRADLAGFITLNNPSKGMRGEAIEAGMFTHEGISYPRLQILTIEELLAGKQFKTPTRLGTRISKGQPALPL